MHTTTARRTAAVSIFAGAALALSACGSGSVPGVPGVPDAGGSPSGSEVTTTNLPSTEATGPTQGTQGAPQPTNRDPLPTPDPDPTSETSASTLDLGDDSPTSNVPAPSPTPGTTPNPTVAPNPSQGTSPGSSGDPAPTASPKAYGVLRLSDRGKYVDSKVPFLAGIIGEDDKVLQHYRFERMDVDFKCTAPDAVAPQNGHFVRVFYILSNQKAPAGSPSIDATEHTWSYLGQDKTPFSGKIVTDAAKKCLKKGEGDDGQWGSVARPGLLTGGELIFDLPSTDGILQQTYSPQVGGWRFPVENANTNFRSLDERAAERFNSMFD